MYDLGRLTQSPVAATYGTATTLVVTEVVVVKGVETSVVVLLIVVTGYSVIVVRLVIAAYKVVVASTTSVSCWVTRRVSVSVCVVKYVEVTKTTTVSVENKVVAASTTWVVTTGWLVVNVLTRSACICA